MNIKSLNFNEKMTELISSTEVIFNDFIAKENTDITMEKWITENLEGVEYIGFLDGLTEREKFLYCYGILTGFLSEKYMD